MRSIWKSPKPPQPRKRVKLPEDLDPAVRHVLEAAIARDDLTWMQLEARADVGFSTIRYWAYRTSQHGPRIGLVRRALNELGYDLVVQPLTRKEELA